MNCLLNRARLGVMALNFGLFSVMLCGAMPGHAAPAASAAAPAARFATITRIRGDVVAAPAGSAAGSERKLREGDPVYVGDRVRAAAQAEAVLKTEDAGLVAVRPNTEFVAERFAAEDKPTDSFTVRLLTGSLRVVSGWIARTNRSGHNIVTPSATIGIRGTDHEPYVLSAELAKATANPEGTYDKVNRGGTTLQAGENKLDIDPGRVGFVRGSGATKGGSETKAEEQGGEKKKGFKERALMTILLPVLLDKVPNFYVPGEFEAEVERYSQTADQESQRQLEQRRKSPPVAQAPVQQAVVAAPAAQVAAPAATAARPAASAAAVPAGSAPVGSCGEAEIAKAWLARIDAAIARHDAPAIIAMFSPEVAVRANVKNKEDKLVSVDLGREDLAKSTIAAIKDLKDYKQRRVWTEARPASGPACDRIAMRSVVIEQGRQAGKPYRFESLEEYTIELRAGQWLAVKAETTQQ